MLFNNVVIIFIILIFVYIITSQFIPYENLVGNSDHYIESNILSHVSDNNIYNRQYIIDNQEGTFLKKEYNVSLLSQPRNNCIPPSTYDYNTNTCTCPPGSSYDITKGCISFYGPSPRPEPSPNLYNTCKPGYTLDRTLNTCVSLCSSNEHFDPINNVCVKNCLSNERFDPVNNVCIADCQYGDWDSWSSCVSGSLVRTRTRKTTAPKNGGNTCAPGIIETDTSFCPINCSYGTWGNWSSCLSDNPIATRTRVTYQPINNGATCGPGWNIETDNSKCPVGCQYGTWSDWSACQSGTRTRTRTIKQAINSGAACPISGTTETQTDNSTCAVGCQYGSWSEWSACQAGNSNRTRTRTLTQAINGGTACPISGNIETQTDSLTCPIGCKYGDWSAWSGCQANNPSRTRTRALTQPINGGAACPVSGTTETQTDSSCPVGCQYGSWSNWSGCQNGYSNRTRTLTQPINGGAACPISGTTETQSDSNTCTSQYNFIGEGGCTNDMNSVYNTCKNISGFQKYGQQSNGCWHCLQVVNSGGNKAVSSYPRGLFNKDPSNDKTNDNNPQYIYIGEGGCTNDRNSAKNTCKAIAGCNYIGQQFNGCWHCLKSVTSGGNKAASSYPQGLFDIQYI